MKVVAAILLAASIVVSQPDPCSMDPCGVYEICLPHPKQCYTTPCDQYQCWNPCDDADAKCDDGKRCVPEKKECYTTPCPQYKCVDTACCKAMTPECLACSLDVTTEEFCAMHPGRYGCPPDCSLILCDVPTCKDNEEMYTAEGDCCPGCVPKESSCSKAKEYMMKAMVGDRHFMKMACGKGMMKDDDCCSKCKKMVMKHAKAAWEVDKGCNALEMVKYMMKDMMGSDHMEMMDEKGCFDKTRCAAGELTCPSGGCVMKSQMCDGVRNCPMGEDEKSCEKEFDCMDDEEDDDDDDACCGKECGCKKCNMGKKGRGKYMGKGKKCGCDKEMMDKDGYGKESCDGRGRGRDKDMDDKGCDAKKGGYEMD